MIKERYEQRRNGIVSENPDFLDVLLEQVTGKPDGFDFADVRAEVDTFMFEGHDTTGSGLTWTLYNIALRPEVEERIIEEVDRVLGDRLAPDWEDMKSFPYLSMVLKESLRLYPPVPYISRRMIEDTDVMGYKLPKGVNVSVHVHSIHRNPLYWDEPDKFIPERFTKEVSAHTVLPSWKLLA